MTSNFPTFKSKKITNTQLLTMVSYMERNPQTLSSRFHQNFTKNDRKKLWEELTSLLNSDGDGPKKHYRGWQKTWSDQKSNVRSKAAKISSSKNLPGGGPPTTQKLNEIEERILSIAVRVSAEENKNIMEAGFDTDVQVFADTAEMLSPEITIEEMKPSSISPTPIISRKRKRSLDDIHMKELLQQQIRAINKQTVAIQEQTISINLQTEAIERLTDVIEKFNK